VHRERESNECQRKTYGIVCMVYDIQLVLVYRERKKKAKSREKRKNNDSMLKSVQRRISRDLVVVFDGRERRLLER